ncbi:hypothetical protein BOTBODRAFT_626187 [Botryobasidium botryosum FD-172 SS1]|uniref:Glucose-methanol-choline oxidoreductase N-terminal domain-containing protein n=1 Tax=Botryobasidium botryosum (strain FD-172 SS1) TaxID=930990 RepID=A0A067N9J9_BOTB1|nr:hypothetical protein BOTBODRAFT_626187 [Botryobasidium botryosum FD-172 SS1]
MSALESEYDIIFVGGGAAGGFAAGRLAAADPSLKILIVEAGLHTRDDLAHVQPVQFLSHLRPDSTTVRFIVAKESEAVGGRALIFPCGQCVGGGSSVNWMMYTRAAASDYDDWETKYGNVGWKAKDLLPLLKKTETYQIDADREVHGYSGPLKVSHGGGVSTDAGKDFIDVGLAYDKERSFTDDPNQLFALGGYARWPKWIDAETGKRSDVAHFLYKQDNKNLHILTGCVVKRVIFEGKRAVGVEYVYNPRFNPNATSEVVVARAKRLVVLSAGSFGSPSVLERSGIGAKSILEKHGVEQLVDLPGVGENYRDHPLIIVPYFSREDTLNLDGIMRGEESEVQKWSAQWLKDGSGLMASNGIDAGVKLRPNAKELEEIGPDFQQRWETFFKDAPDKPVLWMGGGGLMPGDYSIAPRRNFFAMGTYVQHPSGMGSVHITSGDDANAPPEFDTGYLRNADDLALLKWGYKRSREQARRMACYRGEYELSHPKFSKESAAALSDDAYPVDINAPNIVYSEEDEKVLETFVRNNVMTAWHALGTCSMKPREKGGVIDPELNVYGVEGLKVADLSICPGNVAANTYSTALLVAEKAAVIIAAELGIEGV